MNTRSAKFAIGQVVRHRVFPFRGVIFDVDPVFANTEDWWQPIPGTCGRARTSRSTTCWPRTPQSSYVAYVSEQNLLPDESGEPVGHPHTDLIFDSSSRAATTCKTAHHPLIATATAPRATGRRTIFGP